MRSISHADGTVDQSRWNAAIEQGIDLVLHQGDEGADHHGDSIHDHRRKLVAQRFAAAGRHDDHGIAPGQDVADHGFLAFEKLAEAEILLQRRARIMNARSGVSGVGNVGFDHTRIMA